eukprot:3761199-Prymnesium_polylepis.1
MAVLLASYRSPAAISSVGIRDDRISCGWTVQVICARRERTRIAQDLTQPSMAPPPVKPGVQKAR